MKKRSEAEILQAGAERIYFSRSGSGAGAILRLAPNPKCILLIHFNRLLNYIFHLIKILLCCFLEIMRIRFFNYNFNDIEFYENKTIKI